MASLPIPASSELDQIFGGSDEEDDSMLFPMTRTATASDLLDDGFGTRVEDKEDSLLMDVLVQRPQHHDHSDDQSQEEADKMEKERDLLLSLKNKKDDLDSSEREEEDSSKQAQDKDTLKYGLRDRKLIRKRPPQDALYYGEENYGSKAKKKEPEPDSTGDSPSQEEGEEDDEEESEDDTLYCTCKQPHGGRFMICCDKCEEWYHGSCVGVSVAMGKRMEKAGIDYVCPPCKEKEKKDKTDLNKEMKEKRLLTRGKLRHEPEAHSNATKTGGGKSEEKKASVKAEKGTTKSEEKKGAKSEEKKAVKTEEKKLTKTEEKKVVKSEEKRRLSSVEGEKGSPVKKVKEVNGERKAKIDKLVEDRRRFLLGDAVPDESAMKKCIVSNCKRKVLPPTLFCSDGCVERYAAEALNILLEYGMSTQGGISVIDTATGKVIMYATSRTNLVPFLKQHRSYMVHLPTGPNPMKKKAQLKQITPGENKEEKKVESPVKKKREEPVEKESGELKSSKGQKNPEDLRQQAKKALYLILLKRVQETDDLKDTDKVELEGIAGDIEDHLFAIHKDVNHRYKARYRSLLFNLKDEKNKALFRRVVNRSISSDQLVVMSHDQLASDELTKWREEELKKNIDAIKERERELNKKDSTVRKITKKGEEEIERDYEEPPPEVEPSKPLPVLDPKTKHNTTSEHSKHLFDADCEICQGKVVKGIENQEPTVGGGEGESGEGGTVDSRDDEDVTSGGPESRDRSDEEEGGKSDTPLSPPGDQLSPDPLPTPSSEEKNDQSSWHPDPHPPPPEKEDFRGLVKKSLYKLLHSRVKDISDLRGVGRAKLEETAHSIESGLFSRYPSMDTHYKRQYRKVVAALKDKRNIYLVSKVMKGELVPAHLSHYSSEQLSPPVWKGHVYQQGLAKFVATASQVAGTFDHLLQLFPDVLNIVGRISFRDVWAYLDKIKQIPTKTISIVRFDWLEEGQSAYMSLLDYLVGRQRIGVVDVKRTNIKDFYIVPILSGEDLPKVLRQIPDTIGLSSKNSDDLLLGVIVRTNNRGNIQAPPPPASRHSRLYSSHREEAEDHVSTSESKPAVPFTLEVGLGDKTPPLPGESPPLLPTAPLTSKEPSNSEQLSNVPITLYGTVEGMESDRIQEEQKSSAAEEETPISESSLSPLSDVCEDENMESVSAGNVSAYSPSAPIEAGEEEPYSPSNQAPLEENMDTTATPVEERDLEPYSPSGSPQMGEVPPTKLSPEPPPQTVTAAPEQPSAEQVQAFQAPAETNALQTQFPPVSKVTELFPPVSKVTELFPPVSKVTELFPPVSKVTELFPPVSKVTELFPPVSKVTEPPPTQTPAQPQVSSGVSNVQLQNLLAKLPILAQTLLGKPSVSSEQVRPSSTVETPGAPTTNQPVATSSTSHILGDGSHSNTAPNLPVSAPDTAGNEVGGVNQQFLFQRNDPRKRAWHQ